MNPTDEQISIIDAARQGDSLRVLALAGTGKTSTLVSASEVINDASLYLAFNRSIADEARRRFPANVAVKTAHSLAFAKYGWRFKNRVQTSDWVIRREIADRFGPKIRAISGSPKTLYAVYDTFNAYLQSADRVVLPSHVPEEYRLDRGAVADVAQRIFNETTREESTLPVSHDVYLKAWALTRPALPFATILFDEAQDANPVLLDLIGRQTYAQRIWVGDQHQAIYGWRGATDALSSLDLPSYPLTQSWRFGERIAHVANRVLAAKGEALRVRGRLDLESRVESIFLPDVALGRTNAGLFSAAIEQLDGLAENERIAFAGGVEDVLAMVTAAWELKSRGRTNHPNFRFFARWKDLEQLVELKQASDFAPFVRLVRSFGSQIPKLCDRLRAVAVADEREARILFSTVHRYKGREAARVGILDDFSPFCATDRKTGLPKYQPEEANLAYVAITRARDVLDMTAYEPVLQDSIEALLALRQRKGVSDGSRAVSSPQTRPEAKETPKAPISAKSGPPRRVEFTPSRPEPRRERSQQVALFPAAGVKVPSFLREAKVKS